MASIYDMLLDAEPEAAPKQPGSVYDMLLDAAPVAETPAPAPSGLDPITAARIAIREKRHSKSAEGSGLRLSLAEAAPEIGSIGEPVSSEVNFIQPLSTATPAYKAPEPAAGEAVSLTPSTIMQPSSPFDQAAPELDPEEKRQVLQGLGPDVAAKYLEYEKQGVSDPDKDPRNFTLSEKILAPIGASVVNAPANVRNMLEYIDEVIYRPVDALLGTKLADRAAKNIAERGIKIAENSNVAMEAGGEGWGQLGMGLMDNLMMMPVTLGAGTAGMLLRGVKGAVTASAVVGGWQSAAQSFSSNVAKRVQEGETAEIAAKKEFLPSLASGVITGAVTKGFGPTGLQAIWQKGAGKAVMSQLSKITREAGMEGLEELTDEAGQAINDLVNGKTVTWEEAIQRVGTAAVMGAIMGGGINTFHSLMSNEKAEATINKDAELSPEHAAALKSSLPPVDMAAELAAVEPGSPAAQVNALLAAGQTAPAPQINEQNMGEMVEQAGLTKAGKLPEVNLITAAITAPGKAYGANVTIPMGANAEEITQLKDAKVRLFEAKSMKELGDARAAENDLLERVKNRTADATLNIGQDVKGGTRNSAEAIIAAVEKRGIKVLKHTVQQSGTEPTSVMTLDRPLTDEEALEISRELKQDAIVQHANGEGKMHGDRAADWGDFDPQYFLTHEGKPLSGSGNVVRSESEKLDQEHAQLTETMRVAKEAAVSNPSPGTQQAYETAYRRLQEFVEAREATGGRGELPEGAAISEESSSAGELPPSEQVLQPGRAADVFGRLPREPALLAGLLSDPSFQVKDPTRKALFQKLIDLGLKTKIHVSDETETKLGTHEAIYDPVSDTIRIHPDAIKENTFEYVLHEGLHAATTHLMAVDTPVGRAFKAEILRIAEQARTHPDASKFSYELHRILEGSPVPKDARIHADEFVAGLANPEFVKFLDSVPVGKSGTLLTRIVDAVLTALGVREPTTALKALVKEVLSINPQDRERAFTAATTPVERGLGAGVLSKPESRISTRSPSAAKAAENPHDTVLDTGVENLFKTDNKRSRAQLSAIASRLRGEVWGKKDQHQVRLPKDIASDDDETMVRNAVNFFKQNKLAFYERIKDTPWFKRASKQYEGYNIHSHRLAEAYKMTPERIAAAESALSPQQAPDVSFNQTKLLAHLMVNDGNEVWGPEMTKAMKGFVGQPPARIWKKLVGKSYNELDTPLKKAIFARTFASVFYDSDIPSITPEGKLGPSATNANGAVANMTWPSWARIAVGIRVLEDGLHNEGKEGHRITDVLRTQKVASYYNSKMNPHGNLLDYVSDTHDSRIGYLLAFGSDSSEMTMHFQGPKNKFTGDEGFYALQADAGREAASEVNMPPLEFQAGMWTGAQTYLSPDNLPKKVVDEIRQVWDDAHDGKLTAEQARQKALDIAFTAIGDNPKFAPWLREESRSSGSDRNDEGTEPTPNPEELSGSGRPAGEPDARGRGGLGAGAISGEGLASGKLVKKSLSHAEQDVRDTIYIAELHRITDDTSLNQQERAAELRRAHVESFPEMKAVYEDIGYSTTGKTDADKIAGDRADITQPPLAGDALFGAGTMIKRRIEDATGVRPLAVVRDNVNAVREALAERVTKATALSEHLRGMEKGSKIGAAAAGRDIKAEIRVADKWLEADRKAVRDELVEFSKQLPPNERSKFLPAITSALRRGSIFSRDVEGIYVRANAVLERMAGAVYESKRKDMHDAIDGLVARAEQATSMTLEEKQAIRETAKVYSKFRDSMPIDKLEAVHDHIEDLTKQGRALFALDETMRQEKVKAAQREIDAQGVRKLDTPEDTAVALGDVASRWAQTKDKMRRARGAIKNFDVAITPMDWVFQAFDKVAGGALYRTMKLPVDVKYGSFLDAKRAFVGRLNKIAKDNRLNKGDFDMIHAHAELRQEGGLENLQALGYTDKEINSAKTLSPAQAAYLKEADAINELLFPTLKAVLAKAFNQDIEKVAGYFPRQRDWDEYNSLSIDEGRFNQAWNRKNAKLGSAISRTGARSKNQTNAHMIMTKHLEDVLYHIHLGPEVRRIGDLVKSKEFQGSVGTDGQKIFADWTDVLARNGGVAAARKNMVADFLRSNYGAAQLAGRFTTTLLQPLSLVQGMAIASPKNMALALSGALSDERRQFILNNFPEIRERYGDDPALADYQSSSVKDSLTRAGFKYLSLFDRFSSMAVGEAAYRDSLERRGIEFDMSKPDAQGIQEAQLAVRKTQASAYPKDIPLAVSHGSSLSGNASINKMILQFQNFTMTKWALIKQGGFQVGLDEKSAAQGARIMTFVVLGSVLEQVVRQGIKDALKSATGDEKKKDDDDDKGYVRQIGERVAVDMATSMPIVTNVSGMVKFEGSGIPVVDAGEAAAKGLTNVVTGKTTKTKVTGGIKAAQAAAGLGGVPGAGQIGDVAVQIARGQIPDEKKKKPRSSGKKEKSKKSTGRFSIR